MAEFITVGFLLKAATTIKTCVDWARQIYRRAKKETPESLAIAATGQEFPSSWEVKRALHRVLKTAEFENGMERVRNGGDFAIDENIANLLIDEGQFSSGLISTSTVTRLKLLLRAFELGDQQVAQRFKAELLALPSDQVRDHVNEYILKPILEIVGQTDPQWVSDWVAERFLERSLEREDLLKFVTSVSKEVKDKVFEIVAPKIWDQRYSRV